MYYLKKASVRRKRKKTSAHMSDLTLISCVSNAPMSARVGQNHLHGNERDTTLLTIYY